MADSSADLDQFWTSLADSSADLDLFWDSSADLDLFRTSLADSTAALGFFLEKKLRNLGTPEPQAGPKPFSIDICGPGPHTTSILNGFGPA